MYSGLNEEICREAWGIVRPSVLEAAAFGTTNEAAGTIVVLDPHTGKTLFAEHLDPKHEKAADFEEIAHAKAEISWETGMTSREVQQNAPHLYKPTWVKWGGSAVENKLAVAFSGVQAVYDEAISWSVLAWILAICRWEMEKPDGVMASDMSFIPFPNSRPV